MQMKVKELIEYLEGFDQEAEVAVIAANPKARKKYEGTVFVIMDMEIPVLCFDICGESDMDEEECEMAEKCEKEAEE